MSGQGTSGKGTEGHVSIERLHEAVDGALSSEELTVVEAHVAECALCRNEYARLSEVVTRLRSLPRSAAPPAEVWEAVAARVAAADAGTREVAPGHEITAARHDRRATGSDDPVVTLPGVGASGARTRVTLSLPQLAAAAVVVAVVSAGVMWLALGTGTADAPPLTVGPVSPADGAAVRAVAAGDDRYDEVVTELETILDQGRDVLAPETLETIEESLATVDRAIGEVQQALAGDPRSGILRRMLVSHQKTKLGVLQRAAAAIQSRT